MFKLIPSSSSLSMLMKSNQLRSRFAITYSINKHKLFGINNRYFSILSSKQFQQQQIISPTNNEQEKALLEQEECNRVFKLLDNYPKETGIILHEIKKQLTRLELGKGKREAGQLIGLLKITLPWLKNFLTTSIQMKDMTFLLKYFNKDVFIGDRANPEIVSRQVSLTSPIEQPVFNEMTIKEPERKRIIFTDIQSCGPWIDLLVSHNKTICFDCEWNFHSRSTDGPKVIQLSNGWLTLIIYVDSIQVSSGKIHDLFWDKKITKFGYDISPDVKRLSNWFNYKKLNPLPEMSNLSSIGILDADPLKFGLTNLLKFGVVKGREIVPLVGKQKNNYNFHIWNLDQLDPYTGNGMHHLEYAASDVIAGFYYFSNADIHSKDNQDLNYWINILNQNGFPNTEPQATNEELKRVVNIATNQRLNYTDTSFGIPLFFSIDDHQKNKSLRYR